MLGPGLGTTKRATGPPPTKFFHLQLKKAPLQPFLAYPLSRCAAVWGTGINAGRGVGHHHSGDTSEGLGCELQEGMLGWRWISNSEHWLHN